MSYDDLRREWSKLARPWIEEARQGRNPTRTGLLDDPMLDACGAVEGLRVLDCGCGEGRFCRMLAERGAAYVLGLDLCEEMIDSAAETAGDREEYLCRDVQDLGFLENGSFDIVVSYLNQCDLPDFEANNREVFRTLVPGGRFVLANIHPMRSAVGGWLRDGEGRKKHVILDRYFDEGERRWTMMGVELTNFHRTLATYIDGFINAGFELERIIEPTVTEANLERFPELEDELRVPNFIIYSLRKPL